MDQRPSNYFLRVFGSFRFAFRGCCFFFTTRSNVWIHLAAAVGVCIIGFLVHIGRSDWIALAVAIGMVLIAEMLNSALETLTDLVSPEYHKLAGKAKDLAAGAVLLASLVAVIIGLFVFLPRFC
jgi:diacylglycerol kinase (ATP)